jgi:hypothetical protein
VVGSDKMCAKSCSKGCAQKGCARRKAESDFASDCITSLTRKEKRVYAVGGFRG